MNILLTGSTSGIGFATLSELLKCEKNIIWALGRNVETLNSLSKQYPNNLNIIKFDLNDLKSLEGLFKEMNTTFDSLIHCAGIEETVPLTLNKPEKIIDIFKINFFSGVELLRLFTKKKYSNDYASVVFLSSVMGVLGQSGKTGYCSSKAAILGLVKSSALELAKRKIRVNAILPGVVETPMTKNLFDQITEENKENIIKMHPLGIGKVEDIVPTIIFLISNGSKWITGQNIIIDGGYSIQ